MVDVMKVGDEVDSWCTKCREMARHKVKSLPAGGKAARVICDVCNGEHYLRPNPPQSRKSGGGKASRRKVGLTLTEEQKAGARTYDIGGAYQLGDVISHPTFGFGEVTEVRSPQRMMVLFDTVEKLLVCNYQPQPSS
ncbi:MAG: hypothetical protein PVF68_11955 [Acidobacteriota bacterium]